MKAFSIIILIIIFPLFFLAFLGLSLNLIIQKPKFIETELEKTNAYEKISQNIPEIVSALSSNQDSSENPGLSKEQLATVLQSSLSADFLKQNVEAALGGSKNGGQQGMQAIISNVIKTKFESLPVCPAGQDPSADASCRPAGMTFDQLMAQLTSQANNPFFSMAPQAQTAGIESVTTTKPQNKTSVLATAGKYLNLTYIFPVILLIIIFFAARAFAGNWLGSGKIFGIFLSILSLLSLLTNFLLSYLNKPIANLISGVANGMPKLKETLIAPLVNDILAKISQTTSITFAILAGVGIFLFILFLIISKIAVKKSVNTPEIAK